MVVVNFDKLYEKFGLKCVFLVLVVDYHKMLIKMNFHSRSSKFCFKKYVVEIILNIPSCFSSIIS